MSEELKVRIEQEFEHLVAKLGKAITAYDARLVDHITQAKQNVLQHVNTHINGENGDAAA